MSHISIGRGGPCPADEDDDDDDGDGGDGDGGGCGDDDEHGIEGNLGADRKSKGKGNFLTLHEFPPAESIFCKLNPTVLGVPGAVLGES